MYSAWTRASGANRPDCSPVTLCREARRGSPVGRNQRVEDGDPWVLLPERAYFGVRQRTFRGLVTSRPAIRCSKPR